MLRTWPMLQPHGDDRVNLSLGRFGVLAPVPLRPKFDTHLGEFKRQRQRVVGRFRHELILSVKWSRHVGPPAGRCDVK